MPTDPSRKLHDILAPLSERLSGLTRGSSTLGYLTSIASIITEAFLLLGEVAPTVVGGLAVEMYTAGGYATADVDMIVVDDEIASRIMGALGFYKKRGVRYYEHPVLGAVVEFPSGPLDGRSDRINEMRLDDGTALYVISAEDIILDRLAAYVNWDKRRKDSEDATQAVLLMIAQQDKINHEYLRTAAAEKGLSDGLSDIENRVKLILKP